MHDLNKLRLGKSPNEVSNIETRQEVYDAVLEITKQSSKKIAIISKDLEPLIYNQSDFLDALKNMALNGRRAQIRILVSDVESINNADHRLLDLSSKFSGKETSQPEESRSSVRSCFSISPIRRLASSSSSTKTSTLPVPSSATFTDTELSTLHAAIRNMKVNRNKKFFISNFRHFANSKH